jgi:hypothetical protein
MGPPPAHRPLEGDFAFVEPPASADAGLLRNGRGTDPEVAAVAEEMRGAIVARIRTSPGIAKPQPIVRCGRSPELGASPERPPAIPRAPLVREASAPRDAQRVKIVRPRAVASCRA